MFYVLFRLILGTCPLGTFRSILHSVSSQQFCVPNALDCLNCLDVPQSSNFGKRCLDLQLFFFRIYICVPCPCHDVCSWLFIQLHLEEMWLLIPVHCPCFISFCCHWHWFVFVILAPLSLQCSFSYALTRVITFFIKCWCLQSRICEPMYSKVSQPFCIYLKYLLP